MNPKYRHLTSLDAIDPLPELGAKVDPNKPKPAQASVGGPISREKLEHFGPRMTPLAPSMKRHATPRTLGGTLHENMVQLAAGVLRQHEWLASLPKDAKIYGDEVMLSPGQVGAMVKKWREANPALVWKTKPDARVRDTVARTGTRAWRLVFLALQEIDSTVSAELCENTGARIIYCKNEHAGSIRKRLHELMPVTEYWRMHPL